MTNTVTAVRARPLRWAGWAGFGWALAYLPIHVYWALGGDGTLFGVPELSAADEARLRLANWGASLVILGAALVCLAMVRPWGTVLGRRVLLGTAWMGAGLCLLHWVLFTVGSLVRLAGLVDATEGGLVGDWWNLLVFEPWFGGMGVLLACSARQFRRAGQQPVWRVDSRAAGWALLVWGLVTAAAHGAWALGRWRPADLDGALRPLTVPGYDVAVVVLGLAVVGAVTWALYGGRVDTGAGPGALLLAGVFTVVWGVFQFDAFTFAGYGPWLMAGGLLASMWRGVHR